MKKITLIILLFCFNTTFAVAKTDLMHLKINFVLDEKNYDKVKIRKYIDLDRNERRYSLVYTQSKLHKDKLPATLALLVKVNSITNKNAELEFQLLEYGFAKENKILASPRIIFLNGQTAKLTMADKSNVHMQLQVVGNWK